MKTPAEKRFEFIQQVLAADASGKPIVIRSQKTLFGIKSSVEETIERVVAEDEARHRAERRKNRE